MPSPAIGPPRPVPCVDCGVDANDTLIAERFWLKDERKFICAACLDARPTQEAKE